MKLILIVWSLVDLEVLNITDQKKKKKIKEANSNVISNYLIFRWLGVSWS